MKQYLANERKLLENTGEKPKIARKFMQNKLDNLGQSLYLPDYLDQFLSSKASLVSVPYALFLRYFERTCLAFLAILGQF